MKNNNEKSSGHYNLNFPLSAWNTRRVGSGWFGSHTRTAIASVQVNMRHKLDEFDMYSFVFIYSM